MAQRTQVVLIDDLDGKEIEEGAGKSVSFSFSGVEYSIDLSDRNAEKFEKALEPYISNAQRIGGRRARGTAQASATGGSDTKAIREWAQQNGIEVNARGRIPTEVFEKYRAAGN